MIEVKDLFDLSRTIAAALFEGKTYPWEVLGDIEQFIRTMGHALGRPCLNSAGGYLDAGRRGGSPPA